MKMTRIALISLLMILLSAPLAYGQDLSQYRNFSFGMSPAEVLKQVAPQTLQAKLVYKQPAIVQELTWWPNNSSGISQTPRPLWQVLFTFYNGELYRILVTYNSQATKGLTAEDMVEALSTQFGVPTRPHSTISFPTNELYSSTEIVIARWEDSRYSFNLFRSSFLNTSYGLVMFSKGIDTQVRTAFAESLKQGRQAEDSAQEIARLKSEADSLEAARQKNKENFRP